MTTFMFIRGGADGANNGSVATDHVAASFFLAGPHVDPDIPDGEYVVYIRLRDGSTIRDLTTNDRNRAMTRTSVIRDSVVGAS